MSNARPAAVVVLAAGEGTRMRSRTPKVLHAIAGRSLLGHVLAATAALSAERTLVVVGHGRADVETALRALEPRAETVLQAEQYGTGHAVRLALDAARELTGTLLVVPGDAPLLSAETLTALVTAHVETGASATLLTATMPDPTGYGRVVRDSTGAVLAIVEHRDATAQQREIREVGTSVYAFDIETLRGALARLSTNNCQGEEYLTDAVEIIRREDGTVGAVAVADWSETLGVNDRVQLADAGARLRDRLVHDAMVAGVTVIDPRTVWLDIEVRLAPDATIGSNVELHGHTELEEGAVVGPNVSLTDTVVRSGARVHNATCVGADIGADATVGPYTYLRPGTQLGRGAKAGGFVEIKNAEIGADSKVPHLSYVGDASVGERSNIGAATVFVNYDGEAKHRCTVGNDVRIGSDTMLIAPITIADGAYTAAGSVITEDVPAGALGVARARQRNMEGWVERRRPRSPSAAAARQARGQQTGDQSTGDQSTKGQESTS